MAAERELIGFREVAKMLGGIHPEHVRKRLSRRSDFPASFRIGTRYMFDKGEISDWIELQRKLKDGRGSKGKG
jgi:predicted DNA-binding transcriptional regulator AlpA